LITKFFKRNFYIVGFNLLFLYAVFTVNVIATPILIKGYNFTEEMLSIANIAMIAGLAVGAVFSRYILSFKLNYFKFITRNILLMAMIQVVYVSIAEANAFFDSYIIQYAYALVRFVEGFLSGLINFTIAYLLGYKLVYNNYKGTIQGILSSKSYIIKILAPLAATSIVASTGSQLSPYFIALILYLSVWYFIKKNSLRLFRSYYKYICRKAKPPKLKFKYIKISKVFDFSYLRSVYEIKKGAMAREAISIFLANSYRPIYDFYLIILFNFYFEYSLLQSAALYSAMMIGMSFSAGVSYLYDKLYNFIGEYRTSYHAFPSAIINIAFASGMFYLMLNYESYGYDQLYGILWLVMLGLGLTRNVYNDRSYRFVYEMSKQGRLENIRGASLLISDLGHVFGYGFMALLFYLFGYASLFVYMAIGATYSLVETGVMQILRRREGERQAALTNQLQQ